jgi:antitoxin YefM
MTAITATEARKRLFPLIDEVNDDFEAVEILGKRSSAVLISKDEYSALVEMAHLMRSPKNARRLLASLANIDAGNVEQHDLIEDDGE